MKILTDSGWKNVIPDTKPARRIKADRLDWETIRERKLIGWPCRTCDLPAESLHHIVAKSLGGDDVAENCVPLCGNGTQGCHGLVEAHDEWACSLLGLRLTGAEKAYVIAKKGAWYLERRYGLKEEAA